MTNERQVILDKVNKLISKRTEEIKSKLPYYIHEIDDGLIFRYFTDWSDCEHNGDIKYRKIINKEDNKDITIFYYLPKGVRFELDKRSYIHCLSCLSGKMEINCNNKKYLISGFDKICLDTNEFEGTIIEDTYIVTTNKKYINNRINY